MWSTEGPMSDDYATLKSAVETAGFFTTFQPIKRPGDRIVCASRQRNSGLGGNSFWVAKRGEAWFIATWAPRIYRVQESARLTELCVLLLQREDEQAYFDFDEAVRAEFGLVAARDDEFTD